MGRIWKCPNVVFYNGKELDPLQMVIVTAGNFVAARSVHLGSVGSDLCAEALTWQAALDFAVYLGLGPITMEGDSQQVVKIIQGEVVCPSDIEVIEEDVRRLLD